jgi:hypothetical protein
MTRANARARCLVSKRIRIKLIRVKWCHNLPFTKIKIRLRCAEKIKKIIKR